MEADPITAVFKLCDARGIKDMKSHPGLVHIPVDDAAVTIDDESCS